MQSPTCIHHLSYEIVCCHLTECLSPMLAEVRWNLSLCDTLLHKECQQTYVKSQVSSRRNLYLCTRHASIDVGISPSSLAHNDPPRIDVYCKWDSWIHQHMICLHHYVVGSHLDYQKLPHACCFHGWLFLVVVAASLRSKVCLTNSYLVSCDESLFL